MYLLYLNDVIIYSQTFDRMLENLILVLKRLADAGLKLSPKKYDLFAKQVEYLGHIVSECGISKEN